MRGVVFSIGDFARLGGMSIRTLRHYDEIGLVPPPRVIRSPATALTRLSSYGSSTAWRRSRTSAALPVAEEPAELPPPAHYRVLPAIEAASAVRGGLAASARRLSRSDRGAARHSAANSISRPCSSLRE
jgi:MerR family regulatory protein